MSGTGGGSGQLLSALYEHRGCFSCGLLDLDWSPPLLLPKSPDLSLKLMLRVLVLDPVSTLLRGQLTFWRHHLSGVLDQDHHINGFPTWCAVHDPTRV